MTVDEQVERAKKQRHLRDVVNESEALSDKVHRSARELNLLMFALAEERRAAKDA